VGWGRLSAKERENVSNFLKKSERKGEEIRTSSTSAAGITISVPHPGFAHHTANVASVCSQARVASLSFAFAFADTSNAVVS
jgi:hypothetical protein